jgi:hypothetical protein
MAAVEIIVENQTAGAIPLKTLSVDNGIIGASGQATLTDYNTVAQILNDDELLGHVQSGDLTLTVNSVALTTEQSIAFINAPVTPVKANRGAIADPGVDNDETQGYSAGSLWINTATGVQFFCKDASAAAAVWNGNVTGPGSGSSTDEALVRFAGTDGEVQDSAGWTLDDVGLLDGNNGNLRLPLDSSPLPTAEGEIAWDATGNFMVVGDGAAGQTIGTLSDTNPQSVGTAASGINKKAARDDHVHTHGNQVGGTEHSEATNITDGFLGDEDKAHINHGFDTGWSEDADLTYNAGLNINVAAGDGFINDAADETTGPAEFTWIATTIALAADSESWIYVDGTGTVTSSTTHPDFSVNIILGAARTNTTTVSFLAHARPSLQQLRGNITEFFEEALGGIAVDGLLAIENVVPLHIDVASGKYFIGGYERLHSNALNISWTYWYQNAVSNWVAITNQNVVDNITYNALGIGLLVMPINRYRKDAVYITENGSGSEFHTVYGTELYKSQIEAENASLPDVPLTLTRYAARFAGVIIHGGSLNIDSIVDEKPLIGQRTNQSAQPLIVRSVSFTLTSNGAPTVVGEHVVISVAQNGGSNFAFSAPSDLYQIITLQLIGVPSLAAAGPGKNIDLSSEYGNPVENESPTTHAETDTTTVYDFTGLSGLFTGLDLTTVFTGLDANDRCGFLVKHNTIAGPIDYHEIRLEYLALA